MTGEELVERLVREGVVPSATDAIGATAWSNGPRDRYGEHAHPYDKVLVAIAGSIEFEVPGDVGRLALSAGDRLDLPAGTRHGAHVGAGGVRCVEVHVPRGSVGRLSVHPGWSATETGRGRQA